jgi:hypothetical protein
MKNANAVRLIKIASVVFTITVLTLAWMDYFKTGNKTLKLSVFFILATAIAIFSMVYNPESRKAYKIFGIAILLLILLWAFMR